MPWITPPWAIKAAREAAGPDARWHLWFSDRNYSGRSDHRKGEGWIDVWSAGDSVNRTTGFEYAGPTRANVRESDVLAYCPPDPVFPLLMQLKLSGKHVDTAVLELRELDGWQRWTLKHVTVADVNSSNDANNFVIVLSAKSRTVVTKPATAVPNTLTFRRMP